jgi:hypothetical protein
MADDGPKHCFVLSPIGGETSPERERADRFLVFVKMALLPHFEVRRGDDEVLTGNVIHQIIADIAKAHLIVANLEGHNPNVMYELGIAHALSKPIIHLYPAHESLRFDIAAIRGMPYHLDDAVKLKAESQRLWTAAHANVSGPVDNPVNAALGNVAYGKLRDRNNELELKQGFYQETVRKLRETVSEITAQKDQAVRELTKLRTEPKPPTKPKLYRSYVFKPNRAEDIAATILRGQPARDLSGNKKK